MQMLSFIIHLKFKIHGPILDQIGTSKQVKWHQMAIDSKEKMGYPTLVSATVRCCDIAWIGRIRNAKVVGSTPALGIFFQLTARVSKLVSKFF